MMGSMRWSMALERVSQFWGRSELSAEVTAALGAPGSNVVLLGAGGAGKTALGVHALVRLTGENPALHAVHFAATTATRQSPLAVFIPALRDYDALAGESPDRIAQALVKACLEHVGANGGRKPGPAQLVIMIDDVPLLDNLSSLVVEYLLSRTDVRVVLSCRSTPGLTPALTRAWRDGILARIDVPELTRAEIAQIAGQLLAPKLLAPDAVQRLAEATGGNALFLIELLRSLERSEALELRQGLWVWRRPFPADTSLGDILRSELAQLTPEKLAAFETIALCAPVSLALLSTQFEPAVLDELAVDGLVAFHGMHDNSRTVVATVAHPLSGEVMAALVRPVQRMARLRAMYDAALAQGSGATPSRWNGESSELLSLVSWGIGGGCAVPIDILQRAFALVEQLADHEFRILLDSALIQHPAADDAVRVAALNNRIEAHRFSNAPNAVLSDAASAREIIERMPASAARAELAIGHALVVADALVLPQGNWRDALRTLDWAERLAEAESAEAHSVRRLAIARGIYLSYAGQMTESVRLQSELYAAMHSSADFLPLASTLVISLAQRGETKRARAVGRQQLGLAMRSIRRHPLAVGDMVGAWCLADLFTGNTREASIIYGFLNVAMDRNPGHVRVRNTLVAFGRGLLAISQGEWQGAVRNLSIACAELDDFTGTGSEGLLLASLALAQAATGDHEGSAGTRAQFEALGERSSRLLELPARYNLLLAALYAPGGEELAEATALAELARERGFALMELRALHAVALCTGGGLNPDDEARARELANRIDAPLAALLLASCEHIAAGGARSTGSAARALARRGLVIPSGQALSGLTAREQQLAELLALGFSNAQIARRLSISKRTVESHAAKVLLKLQIGSRDDVAVALEALE
ncbi:LuxR C-terminal-related transcriptional regulator [Microterricola viridarii]|uniref:Regulatory protein, luxR family n=1 Tax=Microterricola viridarii TaxID=412690 RepID=A0A1H1WA57_9MICO|nr:LuxR C-terminal-related transcriptional regulator [Microterricola viridarii]SDS93983.1 regulatory protein, luxR family [Microterricola viridarii]